MIFFVLICTLKDPAKHNLKIKPINPLNEPLQTRQKRGRYIVPNTSNNNTNGQENIEDNK